VTTDPGRVTLAHLTTVDLSLRYLVLPQLEAGVATGWETLGISAPGPYVAEVEATGVRHVPLPTSSRGWSLRSDIGAARDLWRILRREHVDILHTHNPKPGLYGRILGRLAGVPIVVNTVHGLYATEDDPALKRLVVYLLEAVASRFSDAELVQSAEDAALMARWRISPRHRTFVLGNGIDLERFDPARFSAAERAAVRDEIGVGDDQVLVGVVGRLVAEKGYPELVEAAAGLDDRYVVVGIGPVDPEKADALGADFEHRAASAGVRLLGMRTDVDRLYAAMDMFVLPSHREGFPRAAMEAAASGLPVIATNIRGCREVVEDGVNGLLISVRAPRRIADAIEAIGSDPALRRAMGEASRDRAVRLFDERTVVHRVFAAYHGVAMRKGLDAIAGTAPPMGEPSLRRAAPRDIPHLARLHMDAISTGFLPRLGSSFMERLYAAMLEWDGAEVFVADGVWRPVGFVAGVTDVGAFYKYFVRHYGISAAFAAAPRLVRPSILRRAWETLTYDGEHGGARAELLSMAVAPEARRRGLGTRLGMLLLDTLATRGEDRVKVVVGADNASAIAAYRKMGFVPAGTVEVHAGETSEVLTWPS
jgi:glycosyltransferase involved in cell wall biosynthesis/ribosomal protein S18 acetylase RimI-like enzyme